MTTHDIRLVKAAEAAEFLSISSRKLWELTNRNAIPCRRIDRSVRYSLAELGSWIEAGCPTDAGAGDRVREGGLR
jgi:predicted DNA-binding transcriptional regulator AlpA